MEPDIDVVVVGAGMAGIYAVHRFRSDGWSVRCFERGDGVGGTWFWNRYPGARCDVPSLEYSYSFDPDLEQEWEWTERYAGQPEIERYLNHVTDRFDLRRDITFSTSVESAHFDDATGTWRVTTDTGEVVRCRFLVMASGNLSSANAPVLPGLDSFIGDVLHTGRWPKEPVNLTGKRVGVIGTGSSGVQSIPVMAKAAASLTVFQRTPNFSVPAGNRPLAPEQQAHIKANYRSIRAGNKRMQAAYGTLVYSTHKSVLDFSPEEFDKLVSEVWDNGGFELQFLFNDVPINEEANAVMSAWVANKIHETVEDPEVARALTPDHFFGCKRLCLDTHYFETFNEPHVSLVDLRKTPIEAVTPTGIRTTDNEIALDTIVLATGFDAMTGSLLRIDIRGRDGFPLRDAWAAGPRNYLGLGVPQFPNMFTVTGPGSPSVLANMVVAIEQHIDWIADCLDSMRVTHRSVIEATDEAADAWVQHVNDIADFTLLPRCNSWYLGANIPGKPRVFMPLLGFPGYVKRCDQVVANGYEGFAFS